MKQACQLATASVALLFAFLSPPSVNAQSVLYNQPSWWFGAAAGANFNFYAGSTQRLNADMAAPAAFGKGFGAGLYLAPLVEYHVPQSSWGFMLQAGYDGQQGSFDRIESAGACNCTTDLSTRLAFATVEPSLRLAPMGGAFYFFAGPRMGFNVDKSFTYKQGANRAFPSEPAPADVKGDFTDIHKMKLSMQLGAGFDIPLSSATSRVQCALSPF